MAAGGSAACTGFRFLDLQIYPQVGCGRAYLSAERTLDMSKQRDIKEPKPGAQPSTIPIIETLKHATLHQCTSSGRVVAQTFTCTLMCT